MFAFINNFFRYLSQPTILWTSVFLISDDQKRYVVLKLKNRKHRHNVVFETINCGKVVSRLKMSEVQFRAMYTSLINQGLLRCLGGVSLEEQTVTIGHVVVIPCGYLLGSLHVMNALFNKSLLG